MESTTKLRALRLQYGISLNDLAVQSGISNQQFSRLELGLVKRTPHKERLANAALWQQPGDRPAVEAVLNRLCVNPMQCKVNDIRAMAAEAREEFDAARSDPGKPSAGSKALIKLRGELVRLYRMQQELENTAQSDSEKSLTAGLLDDLEQISRQAHEVVGFTFAPLEQLSALQ